jgi:hypothetical protein
MINFVGEAMHKFIKKLEKVVRNPYVEMTVALVLVVTGFAEAGEEIWTDVAEGEVGAHHGIIVMGIAHALKVLPCLRA